MILRLPAPRFTADSGTEGGRAGKSMRQTCYDSDDVRSVTAAYSDPPVRMSCPAAPFPRVMAHYAAADYTRLKFAGCAATIGLRFPVNIADRGGHCSTGARWDGADGRASLDKPRTMRRRRLVSLTPT
jgi:hypothetical protein